MPPRAKRAWKMERASVTVPGKSRPRSNKYSGGDTRRSPPGQPRAGLGRRLHRADGTKVKGHYRATAGNG